MDQLLANHLALLWRPLSRRYLVAAFAFNFNNNFVLITLLTNGRPDFSQHQDPGRHQRHSGFCTSIALISGHQFDFGLAAAICTGVRAGHCFSLVNLRCFE